MAEEILELSDSNFDSKVLKSDTPVVVDFWAPWCGPCKLVSPIMEELASEYSGKITFAKIDIAKHQEFAGKYSIRSIPALLFFKEGQVVDTLIGAHPKEKIEKTLKNYI